MTRRFLALAALPLAFTSPALAQDAPVAPEHEWPFAKSDLPVDPAYRFGRLPNGMRYVIRPNGTPQGQGMVYFWVDAGSLAETEEERGLAHFIEHMAFNGSTRVPEGEMIRLLEREGLAFGPDTNASTNFDVTLYQLNLPRNTPALLDTALMLMRETASELSFAPAAVEREKGVVLSELRTRDTYQLRNTVDGLDFLFPGSRLSQRLPIGTIESLQGATAERLRGLYQRLYRPENTAVIVVGEFDPDQAEAMIRDHFASWQPQPLVAPATAGPIAADYAGATDVYLDPALAEQVTVSRHGPALDDTDTQAWREQNVRRQLAYQIINRRLQRLARETDPPFRNAGIGTSEAFDEARTTNLVVNANDGQWRRGLAAAQAEYRRALELGFTEAEVAEQVANLRAALENNVAAADTRSNGNFMTGALTLLQDGQVPTTPQSGLDRFLAHLPQIDPASVLAALKEELVPLDNPLIRFEGRTAPEGGPAALRAAWDEGMAAPLIAETAAAAGAWDYTEFGPAGTVVSDVTDGPLGIRRLTFANGLKVSLKPTELEQDRVRFELNIDGGQLLNTRDDPLATALHNALPAGGLGRLSLDQLQSVLAGRSVALGFDADAETFVMGGTTTARDLELQLQLVTAALTDPGYRPEGVVPFRRNIENYFAQRNATPEGALGAAIGGILSDNDPRFSLQPQDAYLALDFAQLRAAIGDRLAHGAMELALVGDFDPDQALGFIARTLGAVPPRETAFRDYADNRVRAFTADRSQRVLRHDGAAQQAIVQMVWPIPDDGDFTEELRIELLERVARLALTDKLREELGQTYSPTASAALSETYPGFGTFTIGAAVDAHQVDAARAAILETIAALRTAAPDADTLQRARQPMLEAYDNTLKTNAGWMSLVERAQRKPDRIGRFVSAKDQLQSLTAADVQAAATRYLAADARVEIVVLPRGAE